MGKGLERPFCKMFSKKEKGLGQGTFKSVMQRMNTL